MPFPRCNTTLVIADSDQLQLPASGPQKTSSNDNFLMKGPAHYLRAIGCGQTVGEEESHFLQLYTLCRAHQSPMDNSKLVVTWMPLVKIDGPQNEMNRQDCMRQICAEKVGIENGQYGKYTDVKS